MDTKEKEIKVKTLPNGRTSIHQMIQGKPVTLIFEEQPNYEVADLVKKALLGSDAVEKNPFEVLPF